RRIPHVSLRVHPQADCVSCEGARRTVPSPPVGEGQGGGYNTHCVCFGSETEQMPPTVALESVHRKSFPLGAPWPPLSLSLPHKGGGNDVALLCPTARMHSRSYFS